MKEPVAVRVRDCACPGAPHGDGDIVFLSPTPSLACGLAAQADIIASSSNGSILAQKWLVTFVSYGATSWNLLDERGKAIPFDVQVILDDYTIAAPVAEQADSLYGDAVMRPLLARLNASLDTGPTNGSTSPRVQSIRSRRERSSPDTSVASRRKAG